MTDSSGWVPPTPPGMPPPAAQPPGAQPGGPPPAPGTPGWGMQYTPPRSTNSLAIVSLIAGIAQFMFCPIVGAIAAIITGHIGRRQIRTTGEQGGGLATAGLVLGYIGVVLTAIVIAGALVFVFGFSDDVAQHEVRDDARGFATAIVVDAPNPDRSFRDPQYVRQVYERETGVSSGCCENTRVRLADGTRVEFATRADWERVSWRLEFERTFVYTKYACLTIPASGPPVETDGRCPQGGS